MRVRASGLSPASHDCRIKGGGHGEILTAIRTRTPKGRINCPVPRDRLNRGGRRQAHAALNRVVNVRMPHHEPTKTYVARRAAEGKTQAEIIGLRQGLLEREIQAQIAFA